MGTLPCLKVLRANPSRIGTLGNRAEAAPWQKRARFLHQRFYYSGYFNQGERDMPQVQFGHGLPQAAKPSQDAVHFCGAHCVQHNAKPSATPQFGGDTVHFCGSNCAEHG